MTENSQKGCVRKGLDYLVKDASKTLKDIKGIGRNIKNNGLAYVLIGGSLFGGAAITGCGNNGGDSGSSAPPYFENPSVSAFYGKGDSVISSTITCYEPNGLALTSINAIFKDKNGTETSFPMTVDTSATDPTLRDGDMKNGEQFKTQNLICPITGTYTISFNASNGNLGITTNPAKCFSILTDSDYASLQTRSGSVLFDASNPESVYTFNSIISSTNNVNIDLVAERVMGEWYRLTEGLPNGITKTAGTKGTLEQYKENIKQTLGTYMDGDTLNYEIPASPTSVTILNKGMLTLGIALKDGVGADKAHGWYLDNPAKDVMQRALEFYIAAYIAKDY